MAAEKISTSKIVGILSTVGKLSVGKLSTPLYSVWGTTFRDVTGGGATQYASSLTIGTGPK